MEDKRANFCDRNCIFPWANTGFDDGEADIAPVGSYADGVSPYGTYDLAGNFDECVADWYSAAYYEDSPADDPTGPSSGARRALRGGSFHSPGFGLQTTTRPQSEPSADYIGLRCATSRIK